MHERHPVFREPENQNAKIWRYMDFTKFVYLLEKESLFFNRSDKFEDPYEGSLNQFTIDQYRQGYFRTVNAEEEMKELIFNSMLKDFEVSRKWVTINCWHMNEFESDAMWKLYLKSNEGIAIQSTYDRFCKSFNKTEESIFIGKVQYEDFNVFNIPLSNDLYRYLVKRKSFEHEKELRAVNWEVPSSEDEGGKYVDYSLTPPAFGKNIDIDINMLIERVYIAPDSPSWIKKLVDAMLKKYGLESVEVVHSSLGRYIK